MNVLEMDFRNKDGGRSFLLNLCNYQFNGVTFDKRIIFTVSNMSTTNLIHHKVVSFAYHS
jgi:hypothetical protein